MVYVFIHHYLTNISLTHDKNNYNNTQYNCKYYIYHIIPYYLTYILYDKIRTYNIISYNISS